jgi:magnesium transporter
MTTTILTHNDVTWTNIVHPTEEDVQALGHRFPNFHPLNLKDCLTELEYPKLDHHDHYLFLIVQMPYWDSKERISRPAEVDVFIAHNTLVTSHHGELKPLNEMFAAAQTNPANQHEWMSQGASPLLYHLLNTLVDYCFPIVHKVGQELRHSEENLFNNNVQHLLHEIAILRRDIIVLRSIFRPQYEIIQSLIKGSWPFIQEHLDPYWGDISDHLAQLCLLMDQYSAVIDGLSDTIDTLASHRIDEVVRLLTVTTVLTLPVTLLATIFGMNILMPFGDHPLLFFSVVIAGIVLTTWLVWYLRTKKWL